MTCNIYKEIKDLIEIDLFHINKLLFLGGGGGLSEGWAVNSLARCEQIKISLDMACEVLL